MKRIRIRIACAALFAVAPPLISAAADNSPSSAPSSRVLTGIDVLVRDHFKPLQGMKIGLVTNQTGIDRARHTAIDLLHEAPDVKLVALFSPEHGIRGIKDEKISDSRDERTGLPIFSLYGERRAPSKEQLNALDALVFDIQDVGCRFYTYIATMGECLAAATREGKKFLVLDRPNPITGTRVEGPVLADPSLRSFTSWHEIPLRTGMTMGELAKMFAAERVPDARLTVITCEGWKRAAWFDETGLPWENPSPNMRSLMEAILYPGVGLLEFCNVSVGRGTDRPFEVIGAPYVDDLKFAAAMSALKLAGIRFVPVRFSPTSSKFAGKSCGGVGLLVIDRETFAPVDLGIALATTLQRMYPADLQVEKLSKLLGHPATLGAIRAGKSLDVIHALWEKELEPFMKRRESILIYRD